MKQLIDWLKILLDVAGQTTPTALAVLVVIFGILMALIVLIK
jgi:hypothetical protein